MVAITAPTAVAAALSASVEPRPVAQLMPSWQEPQARRLGLVFQLSACATLVLSMDQTETKETEEGTKKDKSKERDKNYPQEQTTHFSDAFDMAVWGVLELKMLPKNEVSGGGVRFR